jgi:hypothetical protein
VRVVGLALLALLALAFLRGVAQAPDLARGDPTPAQGVREAMTRYVIDTPADLARMRRERREHLRVLCREGYVRRGYCAELDKAE